VSQNIAKYKQADLHNKIICYHIAYAIYNVYFHPLSKFPGPKLAAASKLYYAYYTIKGEKHKANAEVHAKYGEVVRITPNGLSFINETVWRDVYMHRQGQPQMRKVMRGRTINGAYSIINAPNDIHARQRKALAHAFSEKAVRSTSYY
jgi:cytochrome P450